MFGATEDGGALDGLDDEGGVPCSRGGAFGDDVEKATKFRLVERDCEETLANNGNLKIANKREGLLCFYAKGFALGESGGHFFRIHDGR